MNLYHKLIKKLNQKNLVLYTIIKPFFNQNSPTDTEKIAKF
jgi:hypothetical protein